MESEGTHLYKTHEVWKAVRQRTREGSYELDGKSLSIGEVVAAARYACTPRITSDPEVIKALQQSIDVLFDHLAQGWYVYGVNTGFGGSADTRTEEVVALQASLMQLTQTGILSASKDGTVPGHSMAQSWVRAAMVVRCNMTLRGHSAVSLPVVKTVLSLLERRLTPVVPLRGSVSASGDLMPLAYVAGSVEGNPDVLLENDRGQVRTADCALRDAGISPVVLGPKEGLGMVNGTASSAGLGALVVADAHHMAFLTQVLTGAAVEALRGSSESFHPFISQVRPHAGQIECARNIRFFLSGSHMARDVLAPKNRRREDLVQDRYSLRSAPQWIGPQLEDLCLADRQIAVELNSSCDNPLIDAEGAGEIYYGCNFQAASVTSAMEKARLGLQMFGRILFAQCTEMIDPTLSGGLPANLAADDPSLSFTMKGVDINMAAYMAELSYLANPMSSHVQSAEMHNQSINSMALASARVSVDALDVLMKMAACHIYVVCQALDLQALHSLFVAKVKTAVVAITAQMLCESETLASTLRNRIETSWNSTGKLDLKDRCTALSEALVPLVLDIESVKTSPAANVAQWRQTVAETAHKTWKATFEHFRNNIHTSQLLGKGSRALYGFVRQELRVPFHEGFVEHPTIDDSSFRGRRKRTVGGWISIVHDSLISGRIYEALMPMAAEGLLQASDGVRPSANADTATGVGQMREASEGLVSGREILCSDTDARTSLKGPMETRSRRISMSRGSISVKS